MIRLVIHGRFGLTGIFVVGSINQDYVLRLDRRPEPGETITDAEMSLFPGGKGANQAVAAARLLDPGRVSILGRVGDEAAGERLVENLAANGVGTDHVASAEDSATGSAFITVTPDGENAIVVAPGANRRFGPDEVEASAIALREASVLVAQMEVGVEAIRRAAEIVRGAGGRVLLNLAPAREAPYSLLSMLDPLVVNEHEAAFLLGDGEKRGPEQTARALLSLGPRSAVVTLGSEGAAVATEEGSAVYPAPRVCPIDTTGAGDAFVGAIAARLSDGDSLYAAVPYAVRAGAAAVAREGAQGAMPYREELAGG
jgi:ribokinase